MQETGQTSEKEIGEVNLLHLDAVHQVNREFVEKLDEVTERTLGRTKGKKKRVQNGGMRH